MTALLVVELARRFWEAAGETEAFPRQLRQAIAFALPVAVVELPRLHVADLGAWLAQHGATGDLATEDRALRAGLVARQGYGLIFLDGTDPDDERRFNLAHETAHFLADYWWPRQRAERQLGPAALEVLDGRRPPSHAERIDATLAGLALGPHVHLMERTPDGHLPGAVVADAERTADALALELLAPAEQAEPVVRAAGADAADRLVERFGLPPLVARQYVARLGEPEPPGPAVLQRLGLGSLLEVSHFGEQGRKTE